MRTATLALLPLVAIAAVIPSSPLSASVSASAGSPHPWVVTVKVSNIGDAAVTFDPHFSPLDVTPMLNGHLFSVMDTATGTPVRYTGRVVKRLASTPEEYITLVPGASVTTTVDLSTGYQFQRGSTYDVRVATAFVHDPAGDATTLSLLSVAPHTLTSTAASVEPRLQVASGSDRTVENVVQGGRRLAQRTYTSCTTAEQNTISQAMTIASDVVTVHGYPYLNDGCETTQYTKWFGSVTSLRYSEVLSTVSNIRSLFLSSSGEINSDCSLSGCGAGTFAYVFTSDTTDHTIHFCSAFWSASIALEFDSKPGTIIHELSHFNDMGATDDHAYGTAAAESLAITNPALAVDNADNFEYFHESYPTSSTQTCPDACFPASATVTLDTGATLPYGDLSVGDRVLSTAGDGSLFFDTVFRITHHEPDAVQNFVRITTAAGASLTLSASHMLHAGACCTLDKLVFAGDVAVGDTVYTVDGGDGVVPAVVTAVETVRATGAFNAHTLSGNIVVDGVAASHFTEASSWGATTRAYAPAWYTMVHYASKVVGAEDVKSHK